MRNSKPALVLPVENQVRELDAKLLMACVAAERGFQVILGSRTFVNFAMPYLPRGVFLAKSLRSISARMFELVHGLGHEIVAWDEESLVRFNSSEYYDWRYSEATFGAVDRLFAWGEDDAELFRGYPGYTGAPIHITGNPRMDLLREELRGYFDDEAGALRRRYGDFILVNTNFPFVNPFVPSLALLQPAADGSGMDVGRTGRGMSRTFAQGYAAHIRSIFEHFQNLIPRLSNWFPEHTIIVRPHPSEDHALWRKLVGHQPRVEVLHEGNVIPWVIASRALLHNGCTTAVEAAVLGKPALSFQPVTSDCYDYHLPNALSHRAATTDEVRDKLAAIVDGRLGPDEGLGRQRILARHVAGTTGPLAADAVMDALIEAGFAARVPPRPALPAYAKAWFRTQYRTLTKRFNRMRPAHRNSAAYHDHRYPEVSTQEIERRIQRLRALTGRFQHVGVHRQSRYIFRMSEPTQRPVSVRPRGAPANSDGAPREARPRP